MGLIVSNLDSMREPVGGHISQAITDATALDDVGSAASVVHFSVDGGDVRVRFDGDDPTTTVGILLSDGGVGTWNIYAWKAAKVVAASGTPVINAQGME